MVKLKGSLLSAKTVGILLRKELNLRHWRRVLESNEWERQAGVNDILILNLSLISLSSGNLA